MADEGSRGGLGSKGLMEIGIDVGMRWLSQVIKSGALMVTSQWRKIFIIL